MVKCFNVVDVFLRFRLLQTAQGSLLDDEQLVNTLNSSKTTSQEVAEQLQVSEQTEIKIDAAREVMSLFKQLAPIIISTLAAIYGSRLLIAFK